MTATTPATITASVFAIVPNFVDHTFAVVDTRTQIVKGTYARRDNAERRAAGLGAREAKMEAMRAAIGPVDADPVARHACATCGDLFDGAAAVCTKCGNAAAERAAAAPVSRAHTGMTAAQVDAQIAQVRAVDAPVTLPKQEVAQAIAATVTAAAKRAAAAKRTAERGEARAAARAAIAADRAARVTAADAPVAAPAVDHTAAVYTVEAGTVDGVVVENGRWFVIRTDADGTRTTMANRRNRGSACRQAAEYVARRGGTFDAPVIAPRARTGAAPTTRTDAKFAAVMRSLVAFDATQRARIAARIAELDAINA